MTAGQAVGVGGVITPAQYQGGGGGGAVASVFGRSGTVVATTGDYTVAQVTGAAPLASPALTGTPTAPTATALTSSTQVATTAYADAAVAVETTRAEAAEALLIPLSDLPLSIANGGTGKTTAALAFAALAPLTTAGDLTYENATPAPARLAIGAANTSLQSNGTLPSWQAALALLATTGSTGYTLVNGTGNILTWTAPNDGALHRVVVIMNVVVTTTEVGGAIGINGVTSPNGSSHSPGLASGTSGTGLQQYTNTYFVEANTTLVLAQTSALTSGAAIAWAEFWGS
jgi:hypothetical protein